VSVEEIVLGTAIEDPSTMDEITKLRTSDFSSIHRDLFDIIRTLNDQDALSYSAVIESLREKDILQWLGGPGRTGEEYVHDMMSLADSRGIKAHVSKIENIATRKSLKEIAALIAAESANSNKDIQTIMDEAEKRIFSVRRRQRDNGGIEFGDLLRAYLPFVDGLRSGLVKPAWIPPLRATRDLVQYVNRSDFVVIAGRPGDGKSSLLRYQALKTAMGNEQENIDPLPVITFNLENDPFEYAKFAIATITGINSAKLKDPSRMTQSDYEDFKRALDFLMNLPWKIVTLSHPTAMEIDRIARQKVTEGYKLIQVDYLQLLSNSLRSRVEDLSVTTGILRGISLRTHVPVIAACQLSRAITARGDMAEPLLSDLRESGSIEQDATQVWFIRSLWHTTPTVEEITDPEFYFTENFIGGSIRDPIRVIPVRVWIKKNRNGPIGFTRPIKWD